MHYLPTLLLILFLTLTPPTFSLPLPPRSPTPCPRPRAIYLWNTTLIHSPTAISTFLTKTTSPPHPFTTVLALIDRNMGIPAWTSFVRACTAAGLAVEALMGDAAWIFGGATGDGATLGEELGWLEDYMARAAPGERFAGVHLDVEPWGLAGWEDEGKREGYVAALVDIVGRVGDTARGMGLRVNADLPFWAGEVKCGEGTLDTCLLDKLDAVTFMTYRNTAESLLGIADPVLEAAKGVDAEMPVWLAVETGGDVADAGVISYAGKGLGRLMADLVEVEVGAERASGGFAGIVIHDYEDFLEMGG